MNNPTAFDVMWKIFRDDLEVRPIELKTDLHRIGQHILHNACRHLMDDILGPVQGRKKSSVDAIFADTYTSDVD